MQDEKEGKQPTPEADKKKEKKPCEHKRTKKEYLGGMDTGDKICLDSGKIV